MCILGSGEAGGVPWAGSLRHVDSNKKRRQREKDEGNATKIKCCYEHLYLILVLPQNMTNLIYTNVSDDDLYGDAPWMGTLRHITHDNMVAKTIKKNPIFKKYPDEDCPNPFKGMQGLRIIYNI